MHQNLRKKITFMFVPCRWCFNLFSLRKSTEHSMWPWAFKLLHMTVLCSVNWTYVQQTCALSTIPLLSNTHSWSISMGTYNSKHFIAGLEQQGKPRYKTCHYRKSSKAFIMGRSSRTISCHWFSPFSDSQQDFSEDFLSVLANGKWGTILWY